MKTGKKLSSYIKIFILLLVLQLAAAAGVFLYFNRTREDLHFTQEELLLSRIGSEEIQSGYIDNSYEGSGRRLVTPAVRLDQGIYEVTLFFQTGNSLGTGVTGVESYAEAVGDYPWVRSARVRLLDFQDKTAYRIYVNKNGTETRVAGALDDGWDSWLLLQSVDIVYLPVRTAARNAASVLFVFLAADLIAGLVLYCRKRQPSVPAKRSVFVSIVAAVICSAPVLMGYLPIGCLPDGMDLHFHLTRIAGLAAGLEAGCFPVRIYPEMLNGYGYANGLFYGDLFLYLPAVLYMLGFSIFTAYRVLVIGMNLLTAFISTFCFSRLTGDRTIGCLTGAVYTFSLYRLTSMYSFSSVGQWNAMAFIPLVILGFYRIYEHACGKEGDDSSGRQKDSSGWIFLTAGMVGILLTHVLTFLMTIVFLLAAALLMRRKSFKKAVIVPVMKAAAVSIPVSCAYLVPFLDAYLRHSLHRVSSHGAIYQHTVFLPQLFTNVFSAAGDSIPYGAFSSMRGEAPASLGMISALILLVSLYIAVIRPAFARERGMYKWLLLTAVSLWLCTDLFPYAALMELMPGLAGIFGLLQFASRFLSAATALIAVLHLFNMQYVMHVYGRPAAVKAAAAILIMTAVLNTGYLLQYCHEATECPNEYAIDRTDMLNIGAGEYLLEGYTDPYDDAIRTVGQDMEAGIIGRSGLDIVSEVRNRSEEEGCADYPLLSYKVYRAVSDEGPLTVTESEDRRVRVIIPAGFDGRVTVEYREPVLWRAAELVSLCSLAVILVTMVRRCGRNACAAGASAEASAETGRV